LRNFWKDSNSIGTYSNEIVKILKKSVFIVNITVKLESLQWF